jgi:hypothetical protein
VIGSKVRRVFARMRANGRPRSALALAGLAALACSAFLLASADPSALCALPALALPLLLALRRYPGERMLVVLVGARERSPRPRASVPTGVRAEFPRPRGGLLLGRALAVRPPPAAPLGAG